MKLLIFILLTLWTAFVYVFSAYAHESDIQRECKEKGRTGSSAWQGELKCESIKQDKE